jgi:hypothetical protein
VFKIIGGDQKEYGPASLEEVCQWIAEGRANGQTLICAEDSTEWKSLGTMPEFASALASGPKPAFGPAAEPDGAVGQSRADDSFDDGVFDVARCLHQGWILFKTYPSLILGAGGLVLVVQLLIAWACPVWNIPISLPSPGPTEHGTFLLPVWVTLVDLLVRGILYGSLMGLMLRLIRGTFIGFGELLADLQPAIPHLILSSVVSTALILAGLMLFILPGIYLAVAWAFVFPVVLDQHLGFWPAMELSRRTVTRQWWRTMGFLLILGGLNLLANLVHPWLVFISLPFSMATLACAYENLFRRGKTIP